MQIGRYDGRYEGVVQFTINEGDELEFTEGGPTDEGYYYCTESYTFEDGIITVEISTDSRDCDGRMTSNQNLEWNPKTGTKTENGSPNWTRVDSSQRDYSAEAMGY